MAGRCVAGLGVVFAGELLSTYYGNTVLHILEPVWQSVVLAAIINVAAQLGDLLESAIKRGAGVKDSERCCRATAASWTASTRCWWRRRRCGACCC